MKYFVQINPGPATYVGEEEFPTLEEAREGAALAVGALRLRAHPEGTECADPAWDEPCNRLHRGESTFELLPDRSGVSVVER